MSYYVISQNKVAHSVRTGEKKTVCGQRVKSNWSKYTKTEEPKCEKCRE